MAADGDGLADLWKGEISEPRLVDVFGVGARGTRWGFEREPSFEDVSGWDVLGGRADVVTGAFVSGAFDEEIDG